MSPLQFSTVRAKRAGGFRVPESVEDPSVPLLRRLDMRRLLQPCWVERNGGDEPADCRCEFVTTDASVWDLSFFRISSSNDYFATVY